MVAPRGGKKLSADQAMKLVYWIATFKKNAEIHELLKENFGFDIKDSLIAHYRYSEDYRSFIQKIRDRWGNDLLHVELATKRRRLEEIENIFEKCVSKEQYKNALMALSQIQHEVEKDVQNLSLTQYNVNVYKDMTDAELEEERLKTMERIKQLKGALPCPVVKNENPESKE